MKKIKISPAILLLIVLIVIILIVVINTNKSKDYELEIIDKYSYFKLYENKKYGVIDDEGKILIQPIYDEINIPNPTKNVFICYSNNKTKVLNEKNEEIFTNFEEVLPIMCEESTSNIPFEKSVLKYKENGKYGIMDFEGKKITSEIYDEIESIKYKEGTLKVKKEGKYGAININGITVINTDYNDIKSDEYYSKEKDYMEAGFVVQLKTDDGYRYGYINNQGKEVLKPIYNEIERINEIHGQEAYFIISKNGKYGILKGNRTLLDNIYEQIEYNANNEVFIVKQNQKQGVKDINGQEVLKPEYDSILCVGHRITATKGESIEIYNKKGEKLNSKLDNTIETANENYIITIDENYKYGIESKNGQVLIKNEYDNLEYAFENYFIATENGKVGVIDINKNVLIDFSYDIIQKVKEKNILQAIVSKTNTIDIYNNKVKKQISINNAVIYTYESYIKLISEDDIQYLDNEGNSIQNKQILKENKLFSYKQDGKWGFIDSEGKIVINTQYDLVTEFNKYGYAGIKKNDKWGVVNEEGTILITPTYKIDWNEPEFINKYYKSNFGYGFEYYTDEVSK